MLPMLATNIQKTRGIWYRIRPKEISEFVYFIEEYLVFIDYGTTNGTIRKHKMRLYFSILLHCGIIVCNVYNE
jgi:hypothetical protein